MIQEPATAVAHFPSAFTPRGLHGLTVELLGTQIVAGITKPDDLLQPEQVGAAYGVSRTVVREALRVLQDKGLLSARPNVGTRIRAVEQWNLLDADVLRWRAAAHCTEQVDTDICAFTEQLRAMRPQLGGNLLYELLMENLTGTPRSQYTAADDGELDAEHQDGADVVATGADEHKAAALVTGVQLAEAAA